MNNKHKKELWEAEMILYFILGILVDKLENIHWLALICWFFGFLTMLGLIVLVYQEGKKEK